nr:complement receptor type 2-like [Pelodiscus sinensis]|eukprot:XP_025034345.1 complement receptor type 2-like [Pelodiscus sinensis]
MIGPASSRCVISGSGVDWDKAVPFCEAIPCFPPPNIAHGSHSRVGEEEFAFGSAVTYSCEKGFSLIGKASIHCTTNDRVNGEWSGPAPQCKVVKCDNVDVKNGRKLSGFGPYTYQNTIMFECMHGYSLVGSNVITCQADNSWSPAAPICKKGDCGSPPRFVFAELAEQARDSYVAGTKVKYSCRSGYVLSSGKSPLVTCLANSSWSSDPDFCEASDSCPQLFIEHGHVTHEEKHHNAVGDVVNIECYTGYSLHGQPKIECTAEHSWQHEIPKCKLSWYIVLIICVIVIIALALAAIWIYKKFFSQKGKTVSTSPTAAYTPSKVIA